MRTLVVSTLLATLLTATVVAQAQDDSKAQAKAAFAEGGRLFEAGQFAEAAKAFRSAHALAPHWKLLYNIGQCEAAAKRYGLALDAFEQYLAQGGDDIDTERREEVIGEVDRLRKMVGGLEIEAPAGSVVLVDGEERGRAPLPGRLRLSAGVDYQVVVVHEEKELLSRTVRVGGGEVLSLAAKPATEGPAGPSPEPQEQPALPAAPTQPPPGPEDGERGLPVLFWVGAGATVVAAGLGAGFWFAADARAEDYDGLDKKVASGEIPPDDKKLLEARDDVELYDRVSLGMWIGAGVLAAATATVLIVHLAGGEDEAPAEGAALSPAPGGFAVRF